MTDEIYDLYKNDPDFSRYVNAFCRAKGLGIFEALEFMVVKEYAAWLKKKKEGKK